MNREDSFENLRTLFAADLLDKTKSLEAALRDANWDEMTATAHKIAGTAKSFGFDEVSVIAAELERSAGRKSPEYSAELIRKISDLIVL